MASQNASVQISQIFTSRKIVLDLMDKQGYNINDYANFSINEVNSMKQNNQLDMLLETRDDKVTTENPKKKIYIRYYLGVRPAPKNLQEMIDDLFVLTETLKKTDTLFIIIKDDPNETLINELKHIWESEGIFIMQKYNIADRSLFPDISRFDPVARVIGLRPGQVCNIIRPSKTAIEANYYRVCI